MQELIKKDLKKSLTYLLPSLEKLRGKNITITGAGFMGSWLARALVWLNDIHGYETKITLITKHPEKLQESDKLLYDRMDVDIIRSDIRSLHSLPIDTNYIIHTVGNPDNRVHMSDAINTMDTIATGTKVLFDNASRLASIEAIIHISSGQVYGKGINSDKINESSSCAYIRSDVNSIYSEAKRYSEALCLAYRSINKLPIIIVRPFSFIGPFQELSKPWAVNSLLQEALNNQAMRIVGNGKPQRSYLYASDMAAWLLVTLANGKKGDIYNLGSCEAVSLLDITAKINKIIGNSVRVLIQNHNEDESKFIPNEKKIKEKFGLKEMFNFDEGLSNTIKWNLVKKGKNDKN
ncbi:MAG: NAD(P)-dependent oxidoreductase [Sulfuricurvum sp.]